MLFKAHCEYGQSTHVGPTTDNIEMTVVSQFP